MLDLRQYSHMYACMRTTIELPDDVLLQAKRLAVDQRTTLRELVIAGLQLVLNEASAKPRRRLTEAPIQLPAGHTLRQFSNEEAASALEREQTGAVR